MSTAAAAATAEIRDATLDQEPALPFRGDNFLGVCEAIGEDLGFSPNWLRIPFAALILWNPAATIAIYLGLGCVVAAARWLFPAGQQQQSARPHEAIAANGAADTVEKVQEEERLAA